MQHGPRLQLLLLLVLAASTLQQVKLPALSRVAHPHGTLAQLLRGIMGGKQLVSSDGREP